jgi:hypothetical protein
MSAVTNQKFIYNSNNCYLFKSELYTVYFPTEWAETHLPDTGPNECTNCKVLGTWNGVFIGYCANCAVLCYKGSRGKGLSDKGIECNNTAVLNYDSIFKTYLNGVDLDTIGNISIENSKLNIQIEQDIDMITKYLDHTDRHDDCIEYGVSGSSEYGSNMNGGYDSY